MKNNIEKVYSKLPLKKHYFRKHKIDLGKIDELDSLFSDILIRDEEIDAIYSELRRSATQTNVLIEDFNKISEEIRESANELGVDYDTIVPSAYFSRINNISEKTDSIKQL
tara:strand:- start:412 stop:744 length:333 start_codon:yes stop_codon:yes gene_type:complete